MKQLFRKLYDNIEVTLLVLLSISFVTGMYMMNKAGGPTTMDYMAQIIIALIIILDIIFLISSRKKENSK
ncbi:hypothetical protein [Bacillus wiedmannii]|uniref:Uncharacterized protein n=1 Tax=Bacillus wiedmannii TaxID=1890302 RepID=A0A2B6RF65_9BACI|nr:hypothetical protein [Bacillus wiedmannii]PGD27608.1 hypothetical protein COM27_30240 [Bacillus wiedmannii]